MVVVVYFHLSSSNIDDVLAVLDSSGNECGKGAYKEYKYLYFFNFDVPYSSVCVKKCPKFDYNQMKYNSTGTRSKPIEPMTYYQFKSKFYDCNHPIKM